MSTAPQYQTEDDAATAFDSAIATTDLFASYAEVPGTLIQPRPGQIDKSVRIDRLLVPKDSLLALGWTHGIIGVELKRSGVKQGPPISQALDYARSVWTLPGSRFQVVTSWVFIWPMEPPHGPLESVMVQNRVGTARANDWTLLELKVGAINMLRVSLDGSVRLGTVATGTKAGSR